MRYLILAMVLFLLQSCQRAHDITDQSPSERYSQQHAAAVNRQLGLAYLKHGDRPRAKQVLLRALAEAPNAPSTNAAMGYFMEKTGETKRAGEYYRKAMRAAPGDGAQLNNYGVFLCRQHQLEQADQYFLRAIHDVHYEGTAIAYENAGLCAMAIPNDKKAMHYFKKALMQDSSRKQSLYAWVKLDVKHNQAKRALAHLQQYAALTRHDKTLLALAADVAHRAGNLDREADYIRQLQS